MDVTGVPTGDITVNGNVGGVDAKCYNALGTITVAGNGTTFDVASGGNATFIAGVSIVFMPGTTVLSGGYLHGYISTTDHCGTKAPAMVSNITGVEGGLPVAEKSSFILYPNPASGQFTIEQVRGDIPVNARVEIYGMQGNKVLTERMNGEKKQEFSVSGFPAGLYFVKIMAGEDVETVKLIKIN